jgi:NADH-quinone oxidoreductase subunit L
MKLLIILIPLLPLIGFLINGLLGKSIPKQLASAIASLAVGGSFVLSVLVFLQLKSNPIPQNVLLGEWINTTWFNVSFAFLVDALSSIFMMVITGVGFLIHIYSIGYMHDDEGYNKFFTYLNLFVFFMLLLVMGDNYLLMFVGWEGVGLASYLLIGFWFKNVEYSNAAKKAFIINRIGDLGFILGISLLFSQLGSLNYSVVFGNAAALNSANPTILTIATCLLFVGAMGKSAQIPLYTWLPDAMAGPTPVSALIHAATMVTAGIYMVARSNALFLLSPVSMDLVLNIGIFTALVAASIGLFQNDIKKVLAYSTVSQLGLIFAALGAGAFSAGVFHVVTHAFFKALLFLGAGSVIHAMSGEQDIRKMGGLMKKLPITFITFLIGTIAISGLPPFAGFFSKDQMLAEILHSKGVFYYALAMLVSLMTAFYMFRLLFLTFFGEFRGTEDQKHHLHESPLTMTLPLIILAILASSAGFLGFPHGIGHSLGIHHWFDGYLSNSVKLLNITPDAGHEWLMIIGTTMAIFAMMTIAYILFVAKKNVPMEDNKMQGFRKLVYNKYYIDEANYKIFTSPLDSLAKVLGQKLDSLFVDGFVNGAGKLVRVLGNKTRELQTGNIGNYLLMMVFAMVLVLVVSII